MTLALPTVVAVPALITEFIILFAPETLVSSATHSPTATSAAVQTNDCIYNVLVVLVTCKTKTFLFS